MTLISRARSGRLHPALLAVWLCAAICWAAPLTAQADEVVTHHPNGSVDERYSVDEAGHKQGEYERWRADGSVAIRAVYADDLRNGRYEEIDPDGTERLSALYRRDVLHGQLQRWRADGSRERVESYQQGELHGRQELYWPHGGRREWWNWKAGVKDGRFEQVSEDGEWERSGEYEDGVLDGTVKISQGGKTISKQSWKAGRLLKLDRLQPFPVARAELLETLRTIHAAPESTPERDGDPQWAGRQAALRRLRVYRALCGLPQEQLELVPEWNALCDAAAKVCRANGGLSHTPPQPPGMSDDDYQAGYRGAKASNLHRGQPDMATSVDGYMDDSDSTNIDRVGHRRWCLNPGMGRTGFGQDGGYCAMWAMDGSGRGPKGMSEVCYPPPGWTPVDLFGARHAWSLALLRGGAPKLDGLQISIRRLDEYWVPSGQPLEIDYLGLGDGGQGTGPCLIFRPKGLEIAVDAAYLVEITEAKARKPRWSYVVAFCEPLAGPARRGG